jgi:polysaccharide export outer membrane protein
MWKCLPVLTAVLVLGGCAIVPTSGPSTSNVVEDSANSSQQLYHVVDIDERVAAILRSRRPDSSLVSFGDYRRSEVPRIGIGDVVSVTIWEAGAGGLFSAPAIADRNSTGSKSATIPDQTVGPDGSISVPYAGRILAAGRSTKQVQNAIEAALHGKAIEPQVLVNVTRSVSNTVTVLGEVTNGARVPLSGKGDRVLDVIAMAGGVRAPINECFIQLMRGRRTMRVAMTRVTSDSRENIFVRPNDVITVIRDPQTFIAYGATGRNSEIPFDAEGVNLAQALSKAGGLLDSRADPSGVFVFRFEPQSVARVLFPNLPPNASGLPVKVVYHLNMRDPNSMFLAQEFRIFNHDLIYVSNAPWTDVQKVMQVFDMAMAPASSGASLYNVTK